MRLIIELIRHELPINKLRNLFKAYKQENPEIPDFFCSNYQRISFKTFQTLSANILCPVAVG